MMEINAIAYLEYWDGESITGGSERLRLVVNFREKGKLLKTNLGVTLVTVRQINDSDFYSEEERFKDYDEYYNYVESVITEIEWLKGVAEEMIKEYFDEKNKDISDKQKKKDLINKVNNIKKIKVNVTIN